jgi:hypothetical protein
MKLALVRDNAPATKRCPRCELRLPLTDFGGEGRRVYCRPCERAQCREYVARDPDRARRQQRERNRRYHARCRDRRITSEQPVIRILALNKRCNYCARTLPFDRFGVDKSAKDGRAYRCRDCNYARYLARPPRDPARESVRHAAYRAKHRARDSEKTRMKKYGLQPGAFERMLIAQSGRCAICVCAFTAPSNIHVDHDHQSGAVRELLCTSCNIGLGMFKDAEGVLLDASRYIARHRVSEAAA